VSKAAPGLTSLVLIELPDLAAARDWYASAEYEPLKELRLRSARNNGVLFVGTDLSAAAPADDLG
jgi:uncharacterized protein (DUF1330 family)